MRAVECPSAIFRTCACVRAFVRSCKWVRVVWRFRVDQQCVHDASLPFRCAFWWGWIRLWTLFLGLGCTLLLMGIVCVRFFLCTFVGAHAGCVCVRAIACCCCAYLYQRERKKIGREGGSESLREREKLEIKYGSRRARAPRECMIACVCILS